MQVIDLGGAWTLAGKGKKPVGPFPATVPGNIELELMKQGVVDDIFVGCNVRQLRPYEFYDWTYEREFQVPADFSPSSELVFEGIDCVADIWLNGVKIGHVDNAFIRHVFAVDEVLRPGGSNVLRVDIQSPILAAASYELDHHDQALGRNMESLPMRRPAHCYGWDIAPRCCLGGLWRGVSLRERPDHRFRSCYFDVSDATNQDSAPINFSYSLETSLRSWDTIQIEIEMSCGDSVFSRTFDQTFTCGKVHFRVPRPKLWWPAGYGEANLYTATVRAYADGELLCETQKRVGLRSVKFEYEEDPAKFMARFVVNGVPIMVKGSNWVPADALHSRDPERDLAILELFTDLGCNMLRVWGGGIYERQEFYDYCDEHGIMVWQDFMIACAMAPLTDDFRKRFAVEVEWAVKELRQHACLVIWAGDNEVDSMMRGWGTDAVPPSRNRLTREVIPEILFRLDPLRPYLPSSPYFSPRSEALNCNLTATPEQHIWGPRDYFKSPFYADNNAVFISETGYHGCPNVSSMKRFLTEKHLWPGIDDKGEVDDAWYVHATEGYKYRIPLMYKQIREEFRMVPERVEDFSLASQIVQAEAKKFFIENVRIHKWKKAGVLWWNIMDCWPQFSDAIVDYYFSRKLAYDYIKRSQKPLLALVGEWRNWGHDIVITNDALQDVSGHLTVKDGVSNEILLERDFTVGANANCQVAHLQLPNCDQRLLLLHWETSEGETGDNHYVTGRTPLDYEQYRDVWLPLIKALEV